MVHERSMEEIKSVARKKAMAESTTIITILSCCLIAARYLAKDQVEWKYLLPAVILILVTGLITYFEVRKESEFEECRKNEIVFEGNNLSQEKEVLVEPLEETESITVLKKKGAKLYAKLTAVNNICVMVKFKDGSEEVYSWLNKGNFRENYKIV